jgi:PAS domain S-box-containing protein
MTDIENQLQKTMERVSDGIISLDKEWRYIFINEAAMQDHPTGSKDVLGRIIWEIHPELKKTVFWEKSQEAVEKEKTITFENFYEPLNKWFNIRLYPSNDGLTIYYQNISKEKVRAELTRINQERLLEAQSVANVGNWETDLKTMLSIWSRQTYHIFEKDPLIFHPVHNTLLDMVHPDDKESLNNSFYKRINSSREGRIEFRINTASGLEKWVENCWKVLRDEHGLAIRARGTFQEITDKKTIEIERELLINNTEESFILLNKNLEIVSYNKQSQILFNKYLQFDLIRGRSILDYAKVDRRNRLTEIYKRVLTGDMEESELEFSLPDGSTDVFLIIYKPARNEKSEIIGVFVTIRIITERINKERELRKYNEEIIKLTAHLEQIREEERTQIAREVHDELGQQLTGLKMDASWLLKQVHTEHNSIHQKISDMTSLIDHSIKTIRRISSDLRPGILDDLGLIAALQLQNEQCEKKFKLPCIFKSDVDYIMTERHLAIAVYRINQEALTNIIRHSNAKKVKTTFRKTHSHLNLTIKDNGNGFDKSDVKKKDTLGLIGMRERSKMVGTELSIISTKGRGTTVTLRIPLSLIKFPES